MFMHRFIFALVGITAAAAAAVAIARSSTETSIRSLSKAQSLAAKCPMIDWPYGCKWRPVAQSETKHVSARKSKRSQSHTSFLSKRVR
jgi:acyl-CoA synthetase (AMP-forming)/AMP-acid ligase II